MITYYLTWQNGDIIERDLVWQNGDIIELDDFIHESDAILEAKRILRENGTSVGDSIIVRKKVYSYEDVCKVSLTLSTTVESITKE